MKKILSACLCATVSAALCGCSLGTMLEEFTSTGDLSAEALEAPAQPDHSRERIYMDEITGTLEDFTGSVLRLSAEDTSYTFDVSQASLECKAGIISGDQISVIYEGQLESTDTSMVKALKVVDVYHNKPKLKTHKLHGTVLGMTPNTITVKSDEGITATYPITGTPQYYQGGLQKGSSVYIKFKGKPPKEQGADHSVQNPSHLKVLSISDVEDFSSKELPKLLPEETSEKTLKTFRAQIQTVDTNTLQILLNGHTTAMKLDLASVPSCFGGGLAPGSGITVTYGGELREDTLEGISIHSVVGDDPRNLSQKRITFSATGSVIGTTANTVTIKTTDGALDIFRRSNASDSSTGSLAEGSMIKIIFNPAQSGGSNIYEAIQISDV